ncbi:MAG: PKD domain-containing protein, partial [Saprospiraceae bacterium]|nr:PKD domain-containing protein [Saprospiraceae bacterium]
DYEPVAWHWDFGDGAMSQDTSPVHAYAHAGVYEVCLTVSNAYGSDTLCRVLDLSTVGAEENPDISNLVSVGPNPFGNYLSVALSVQLRNPVFSLYDQTGRIVRNNVLVYWLTEVKTADLPAGLYFWEVRSGSELVQVGKAVKID